MTSSWILPVDKYSFDTIYRLVGGPYGTPGLRAVCRFFRQRLPRPWKMKSSELASISVLADETYLFDIAYNRLPNDERAFEGIIKHVLALRRRDIWEYMATSRQTTTQRMHAMLREVCGKSTSPEDWWWCSVILQSVKLRGSEDTGYGISIRGMVAAVKGDTATCLQAISALKHRGASTTPVLEAARRWNRTAISRELVARYPLDYTFDDLAFRIRSAKDIPTMRELMEDRMTVFCYSERIVDRLSQLQPATDGDVLDIRHIVGRDLSVEDLLPRCAATGNTAMCKILAKSCYTPSFTMKAAFEEAIAHDKKEIVLETAPLLTNDSAIADAFRWGAIHGAEYACEAIKTSMRISNKKYKRMRRLARHGHMRALRRLISKLI